MWFKIEMLDFTGLKSAILRTFDIWTTLSIISKIFRTFEIVRFEMHFKVKNI